MGDKVENYPESESPSERNHQWTENVYGYDVENIACKD